jgi:hypothetical protein
MELMQLSAKILKQFFKVKFKRTLHKNLLYCLGEALMAAPLNYQQTCEPGFKHHCAWCASVNGGESN